MQNKNIKKILPDQHHHRVFVKDVIICVLILVDSALEAIVIAQNVVVGWKPFLSLKR